MKRIVVLVNKDFEYKGFIEGLRDTIPVFAGTNGRDAECLIDNLRADIYCIQHLFKPGENSSNSEVKYGLLKDLFKSNVFRLNDVDGVLSVSTAESTPHSQEMSFNGSCNGDVWMGSDFFLSDQSVNDPTTTSNLKIGSAASHNAEFYSERPIFERFVDAINFKKMNFLSPPNNSSDDLHCYYALFTACVGVVNVMDYSCYKKADKSAYKLLIELPRPKLFSPFGVCIETTHGVVVKAMHDTLSELNMKKNVPVNFVSPIVDRYLKFDEDVDDTDGKQNFVCSYNGGVAVGNALKLLAM